MTYEYECTSCSKKWDEEQSIKDNPIKTCPSCNKDTAKRLISNGSFILQGSGWFKTGGY